MADTVRSRAALALAVAALAFASWGGWTWWQASNDESVEFAQVRDEVLATGRSHVTLLSSLDTSDMEGEIDRWLDVSTGVLRDQLSSTDPKTRAALKKAGTVADGRVLAAAVSELNLRAGTAKLLASVEISITRNGGPAATKHKRYIVGLSRTDRGWLVSALDPVPLGTR